MSSRSKLYTAFFLFFSVLVFGSMGYMLFENFTFVNALYMTVLTMSTVGFNEVQPLDQSGKLFTVLLIFMSIGSYGYLISVISEYISNTKLMEEINLRRSLNKIDKLNGHIVICGFGRNGRQAALKLSNYDRPCVVIEKDEDLLAEIEAEGMIGLIGDPTEDGVLEKANLTKALSLITTLPSDADNLFVVLSGHQLNPDLRIVSRASQESSMNKLKIAGAHNVIMPDKIGGDHMASVVVTPDLVEFVSRISVEGKHTANLEEIEVDDLSDSFIGKTVKELDMRKTSGCNVIGYIDPFGNYEINPGADTKLQKGAKLIVLGKSEEIRNLKDVFNY